MILTTTMSISDYTLMIDSIQHEVYSGSGSYGERMYGSAVSYTARVNYKQQLVKDPDGEDVVSSCSVWIKSSVAVDPQDRITLLDSKTPNILAVERYSNQDGAHHTKVYFQ